MGVVGVLEGRQRGRVRSRNDRRGAGGRQGAAVPLSRRVGDEAAEAVAAADAGIHALDQVRRADVGRDLAGGDRRHGGEGVAVPRGRVRGIIEAHRLVHEAVEELAEAQRGERAAAGIHAIRHRVRNVLGGCRLRHQHRGRRKGDDRRRGEQLTSVRLHSHQVSP